MKLREFDLDKYERRSILSPGVCIYCGDPFPVDGLTDEHVIPYALGRDTLIFKKSSCKRCAEIIQPYEQDVLRKQWGSFRLQVDAPSRTKKKDRPTSIDLPFVEVDSEGRTIRDLGTRTYSLDDAPLTLSLWELPEPRIMRPDAKEGDDIGRPWTYVDEAVAHEINRKVAEETGSPNVAMKVAEVNRNHFLRFLAKTAHAYAVAELGMDGFRPFLTGLILRWDDDLAKYVGGTFRNAPHDVEPGHTTLLAIGGTSELVAVRLQFYHWLGAPAYAVVVGERNENTEERIEAMIERYSTQIDSQV